MIWDASFIPKSGKKTYGKDNFWNGKEGRNEKGLEISALAVADPERHTAFHLDVEQTPADLPDSRILFYLNQVLAQKDWLQKQKIKHIVTDNYCLKKSFVNGLVSNDFHHISRMRKDADLYYLADKLPVDEKRKRGAPKKQDGKIDFNNLNTDKITKLETVSKDKKTEIYTLICWSKRLKRKIRLVIHHSNLGQRLLYSTDIELDGLELMQMYKLRFQIEFIFRETKQHCGLTQAQTTQKDRLKFHFDMSFTTYNWAKTQFFENRKGSEHFSMAEVERQACLKLHLKRFFENSDNQLTLQKILSSTQNPDFSALYDLFNL